MKNLWQKLVERHRRNKAELDQIELEHLPRTINTGTQPPRLFHP
jgi:hypothetical protein